MDNQAIVQHRLANQQIARPNFEQPDEVVNWLGAVQAQDYRASLWALGLRLPNATEATIEQALADKIIVRTWPMRGTLHLVAAVDVRWMVGLMAPRVRMLLNNMIRYQRFDLDEAAFAKNAEVLTKALQGGKQLTRLELTAVFAEAGIVAEGLRLTLSLQRAVADGLLCFGARRSNQPTFTLLAEWLPPTRTLTREESLAELVRRYFTSHGPATVADLVWWSGLTMAEVKAGLEMIKAELGHEVRGKQTYWFAPSLATTEAVTPCAYLLPGFDEYLVGYRDRSATLNPLHTPQVITSNGILNPSIVIDGQIVGTWKRELKKTSVIIQLNLFTALGDAEMQAIAVAAEHYGHFLNKSVAIIQ
jgi:hypothetical protein